MKGEIHTRLFLSLVPTLVQSFHVALIFGGRNKDSEKDSPIIF